MAKKEIEYYEGLPIIEANDKSKLEAAVAKLGDAVKAPFAVRATTRAKSIKAWSFEECQDIAVALLPSNILNIGDGAFYGCVALKKVVVEAASSIESGAFNGCTALEEIILPQSMETIGQAFKNCTKLPSIRIPEGIKSISYATFEGCSSLKEVSLPSSLELMRACFQGCTSLECIELPPLFGKEGLGTLDQRLHTIWEGLEKTFKVVVPASQKFYAADESGDVITTKDKEAVSFCGNMSDYEAGLSSAALVFVSSTLNEVRVPEGITNLSMKAFDYCTHLKKLIIPASVELIKSEFKNHPDLEYVELPASAKIKTSFAKCPKVKFNITNNPDNLKIYKRTFIPYNYKNYDDLDAFERNMILLRNKANQDGWSDSSIGVDLQEDGLYVEYENDNHYTVVLDGKCVLEVI